MINAQSLSYSFASYVVGTIHIVAYTKIMKCFQYKSHERLELEESVGIWVDSCWHAYSNLSTQCMYYVAAILPVVLLIKITDENIPSLILIPVVLNSRLFYSSHLDFNVSMI